MIIKLDELNFQKRIDFSYEVKKDENLDNRILDLKNTVATGYIIQNSNNNLELYVSLKGTMVITDSITLEPVDYSFATDILENDEEIKENYPDCINFSKNTLDLKKILWQNIVLEVPMSFTTQEDAKLKGNGWELISGDKKSTEIDPRLKKLEDILKGDD